MTKTMDSSFLSRVCQIVVVGNNSDVYNEINQELGEEGFEVMYRSPESLSRTLETEWIDVVLLDRSIPPRTATALCKSIRRNTRASMVPILIVDDDPDDQVYIENLRAGADDFVSLQRMRHPAVVGRIKTLIRRRVACNDLETMREPLANIIQVGMLTIRLNEYEVRVAGEPIQLSLGEFRLLGLLASDPKRAFTREQITSALSDIADDPSSRAVDARIYTLRRKLGEASRYVRTIRGVGFKLDAV